MQKMPVTGVDKLGPAWAGPKTLKVTNVTNSWESDQKAARPSLDHHAQWKARLPPIRQHFKAKSVIPDRTHFNHVQWIHQITTFLPKPPGLSSLCTTYQSLRTSLASASLNPISGSNLAVLCLAKKMVSSDHPIQRPSDHPRRWSSSARRRHFQTYKQLGDLSQLRFAKKWTIINDHMICFMIQRGGKQLEDMVYSVEVRLELTKNDLQVCPISVRELTCFRNSKSFPWSDSLAISAIAWEGATERFRPSHRLAIQLLA